jgi:hypothetical protein
MAKGNRPAGGSASRVVRQVGNRLGQPAQKINPSGVSQFGEAVGNKPMNRPRTDYRGDPVRMGAMDGMGSVPLGNAVATQTVAGPGGSRTVNRTGGQGQHGPVAGSPKPAGRDILSDFGPDYQNARTRG